VKQRDAALDRTLQTLVAAIEQQYPNLPNARWVALRLLDGDASIEAAIRENRLGDLSRVDNTPSVEVAS
jgi:ferrous iron transport protein B